MAEEALWKSLPKVALASWRSSNPGPEGTGGSRPAVNRDRFADSAHAAFRVLYFARVAPPAGFPFGSVAEVARPAVPFAQLLSEGVPEVLLSSLLPTPQDESLVRRVRARATTGPPRNCTSVTPAVSALVQANLSRAVSARVDADDIVQSVFRCFFQAVGQGRYALPSAEELWSLLAAITVNRLPAPRSNSSALKRDVAGPSPITRPPRCRRTGAIPTRSRAFLTVAVGEAVQRLPARLCRSRPPAPGWLRGRRDRPAHSLLAADCRAFAPGGAG